MFYNMSTLVGYLMTNPVYTYTLFDLQVNSLLVTIFKRARAHFFEHSSMVSSMAI